MRGVALSLGGTKLRRAFVFEGGACEVLPGLVLAGPVRLSANRPPW